jgi:hypothetical protein
MGLTWMKPMVQALPEGLPKGGIGAERLNPCMDGIFRPGQAGAGHPAGTIGGNRELCRATLENRRDSPVRSSRLLGSLLSSEQFPQHSFGALDIGRDLIVQLQFSQALKIQSRQLSNRVFIRTAIRLFEYLSLRCRQIAIGSL